MSPISIERSADPRRADLPAPVLVAHQPEFLPYLGNIAKATMGDVYVILDELQFEKQHWQSRNRIRTNTGDGWQWLILPLEEVGNHMLLTTEVRFFGSHWKKKHLKAIQFSYSKSPFFKEIFPELEAIYLQEYEFLIDFLIHIIRYAFQKFNIRIPVYRSSELKKLGYDISGEKSDHLIRICKPFEAAVFIFGKDGKNYYNAEAFDRAKILPVFQDFHHPGYSQIHQGPFVPNLSFIDLLFNHGEAAPEILGKSSYTTD